MYAHFWLHVTFPLIATAAAAAVPLPVCCTTTIFNTSVQNSCCRNYRLPLLFSHAYCHCYRLLPDSVCACVCVCSCVRANY
jgi:hypothetical protein